MRTFKASRAVFLFATILLVASCGKMQERGEMTVKLTNSASRKSNITMVSGNQSMKDLTLLTAINLDVQQCEIHYSGSPGGWVSLATNAGIYNLLDIDTDATVVLVDELTMPLGSVTQMRLILGNNNSLVIAGNTYPLKVPSGEESGLKIMLKENISFTSAIEIWLDFDPFHSVVELGNGGYILKPVIQVDVVYML